MGLTPAVKHLSVSVLNGAGAGEGWDSASVSVPREPALAGQSIWMQWAVLDPTVRGLLAASEAVELPLF